MSETPEPEPLVVPEELASRVRAVAEQGGMSVEETLADLLALVLEVVEKGPCRTGRWLLSFVDTDDGPTPPAGLGTAFQEFSSRWSVVRVPASEREPAAPEPETTPGAAADSAEDAADAPRCELCVLRRDDDATAIIEVVTTTGEAVVFVQRGEHRADIALPLECHEAWLDLGARVWRRVMHAADELADGLAASGDDKTDEPPGSDPSS